MGHIRTFILLIIGIAIIITSCRDNSTMASKSCVIEDIIISIPHNSRFQEKQGIDVRFYEITLKDSSKIFLQYGKNVFQLSEDYPQVFSISEREIILRNSKFRIDSSNIFFSKTPEEDQKQNIFSSNYYLYDTINQISVKLVMPKKPGKGMIGLYTNDLAKANSFCIYAFNFSDDNISIAKDIFGSIRRRK